MASYLTISDFYPIGEEQRSLPSSESGENLTGVDEGSPELPDPFSVSPQDESDVNKIGHSLPEDFPTGAHQDVYVDKDLIKTKRRRARTGSSDANTHPLSGKNTPYGSGDTPPAKIARVEKRDDSKLKSFDSPSKTFSRLDSPVPVQDPLQLSSLASVTGINASRNKQVNILAMIEHVSSSTVKPTTAPLKRDVRLVDPSTDKKVVLSVFIDPVNFVPREYDIILFRDLTTYDFFGGNLNAYPKKCRGRDWYLLDPYDIEECDMESMELFREEYRAKSFRDPDNRP